MDLEEIIARLQKIYKKYGNISIFISDECGFGGVSKITTEKGMFGDRIAYINKKKLSR